MRENSRVPPSRRSPEEADRPGDEVLAASLAPDEPSLETAGPAARGQGGPGEPAGLPRRVRGTNGLRPPVRVERPAFSDSMLERVRAAVAAESGDEPDELAPPRDPGEHVDLFGSPGPPEPTGDPAQEPAHEPAQESAHERAQETASPPVQPLGAKGAGKPLETVSPPFPLRDPWEPDGAPGEITQPISAITRGLGGKGSGNHPPGEQDTENAAAAAAAAAPAPTPTRAKPAARRSSALSVVQGERPAKPKAPRKTPKSGARKPRSGRGYRVAGLVAIVLVAMGAGVFAFVHYGHRPEASAAISSADLPMATRNSAATWVAGQVATGDVVACDPVMCRALETRGMAAARLRVLWPGSDNLAGAAVVVATPAVQSHLGARLDTVDAPGIIARFGAGNRQIVIRAMAPQGAAAYRSAVAADLSERRSSGQVLVSKSSIHWSAAEKKQLAAGQVDVRLMVAIVDLAANHPVQVVAFGDGGPGAPSAPLRSAELAYSGSAGKKALLDGLAAVATGSPVYRPSHIAAVRLRGGQTVLQVEFSAPSPLGLLGGGA